jgi:excisionase family DNA binding protein
MAPREQLRAEHSRVGSSSPEDLPAPNGPATFESDKGYISLAQFALLEGVSYQTVLRWKDQDLIKAVHVGGRFRIYDNEVDRWRREGNRGA